MFIECADDFGYAYRKEPRAETPSWSISNFFKVQKRKAPSLSLSNKRLRNRIRRLSLLLSFFDFPFYFRGFYFLLTSTDLSLIETK